MTGDIPILELAEWVTDSQGWAIQVADLTRLGLNDKPIHFGVNLYLNSTGRRIKVTLTTKQTLALYDRLGAALGKEAQDGGHAGASGAIGDKAAEPRENDATASGSGGTGGGGGTTD